MLGMVCACSSAATPPMDGGPPNDSSVSTKYVAEVEIIQNTNSASASGIFREAPGIVYDDLGGNVEVYGCITVSTSECVFRNNKGCPSPPSGPGVSADTITIANGASSAPMAPDTANANYIVYSYTSLPGLVWNPGDLVGVSAAGAEVPAFTGSVAFPEKATVTTPTATSTIDRTTPLPVAWSGATTGVLRLTILDASGAEASCDFTAGAGTGSIPTKILAPLAAGSASIDVSTRNVANVVVGDWTVALVAQQNIVIGTGNAKVQ